MTRLLFVIACIGLPDGVVGEPIQGPAMAKWLVDRGRFIGLNADSSNRRDDAEIILVWMLAAARIDPQSPEPFRWQYDLAARLGRLDAARAAIDRYHQLRPDDTVAQLALAEISLECLQQTDPRLRFCRDTLRKINDPFVKRRIHARLAELLNAQGDTQNARMHLQLATPLVPRPAPPGVYTNENVSLNELAQWDEMNSSPGIVRARLARIAESPADPMESWNLARLLDNLSLHDPASEWFQHAQRCYALSNPDMLPPMPLLIDRVTSAFDGGSFPTAIKLARDILSLNNDNLQALAWVVRSARRIHDEDTATPAEQKLIHRLRSTDLNTLNGMDAPYAALIAWLQMEFDPDPENADAFAQFAFKRAPDDPIIRRIFAVSRLHVGDWPQARELLQSLIELDPWAAEPLARGWIAHGNSDEAIAVLRTGERLKYSGIAYERITRLLTSLGQPPATPPDHSDILTVLDAFDRRPLTFVEDATQFLRIDVEVPREQGRCNGRMPCTFRLENTGPIDITLGPGRMVDPQVLVSVDPTRDDDRPCNSAPLTQTVTLHQRWTLQPGEVISKTQTIILGEPDVSRPTESETADQLRLAFILDPVTDRAGQWKSRLHHWQPIIKNVQLSTHADQPNASTIANRLASKSPIARASALTGFYGHGFDPDSVKMVAPSLADEHWLIRLIAVDLIARWQGSVFDPVLDRLRSTDPDPLVRRLADLLRRKHQS